MELWCQLKLFLLIILMLDQSAATLREDTQHELVDETCDLTKLLVVQQDIARQAREEVVKKDGSIRQLRQDITTVQKTLKLVSDGAVLAQQQLKGCLEKNNDLEHQVTVNDAAAHQQIINILSLANHIDNKTCDCLPQFQNLKEEISDLIDSKCNNKKLPDQLVNTTEEMKLLEQKCNQQLGEINGKLIKTTEDNTNLQQAAQQCTQRLSSLGIEKKVCQDTIDNDFALNFKVKYGAKLDTYAEWGTEIHFYKSPDKASHSEAAKKCQAMGMWLAKPAGPGMNHLMFINLLGRVPAGAPYWIGLEKQIGAWFWTDPGHSSIPMVFQHWKHPSEPSGDGNCASVSSSGYSDYSWNDQPCSDQLNYICQYPRYLSH